MKRTATKDLSSHIKDLQIPHIELEMDDEVLRKSYEKLDNRIKVLATKLKQTKDALNEELAKRESAEKALMESEAHLRSLMESASSFAVFRLFYKEKDT